MAPSPAALLIRPGAALEGTTTLLGLTLERRLALAARRAGFGLVRGGGESDALPEGRMRLVAVTTDLVPRVSFFKALLAMPLEPEVVTRAGAAVLAETDLGAEVAAVLERGAAEAGAEAGEPAGSFLLRARADLPAAERWLLRGLIKDEDGFMSRHVERKISLAITRLLAGTRVTPNAMTLVSVAFGLAGAPFFLSERPAMELVGALLILAHSILDGCDGELARVKFQESRWGGILDFWGDNVVHVAVFLAMSVGWSRTIGASWPLLLGASAAAGTILSALFVYRTTMTGKKSGPLFTSVVAKERASRVSRLADALARRDFIYLVVILSAFGKARWFLALAAVGSPAFFAVLVLASVLGRRLERRLV